MVGGTYFYFISVLCVYFSEGSVLEEGYGMFTYLYTGEEADQAHKK